MSAKMLRTSFFVCCRMPIGMCSVPDRHHLYRRNRQNRAQGRESVDHQGCLGRGCPAGAAQNSGRDGRQCSSAGRRKHPHQEFTPVDTTNILFICGGAFVGLEKVIARRVGTKSIGFVPPDEKRSRSARDECRCGATPTCCCRSAGRFDQVRLHSGVHRPNAGDGRSRGSFERGAGPDSDEAEERDRIRQYQKLFEFENVKLKFSDDALDAVAQLAMERKVGARGLRMILEDLMLDLMYYLPHSRRFVNLWSRRRWCSRKRSIWLCSKRRASQPSSIKEFAFPALAVKRRKIFVQSRNSRDNPLRKKKWSQRKIKRIRNDCR
jgi:hypothetical protein